MASPLSEEDIQPVVDALVPIMIQHDYQRRDSAWYYFTPELLRVFEYYPSRFRKRAFLNIGLLLRTLDDSTRPRAMDCSVFTRINHLVPDPDQHALVLNFGDPALTITQRVGYIAKFVQEIVLPFLANFKTVEDVSSFVCSPQAKGCVIQKSAQSILT
jgi:hypothetical protein